MVDQRRQGVEEADQQGALVAPDWLQLRIPLVLDLKLSQAVDDLQTERL